MTVTRTLLALVLLAGSPGAMHPAPSAAAGEEPSRARKQLGALERLANAGKAQEALAKLQKLLRTMPADERMLRWKTDHPQKHGRFARAWLVGGRVVFTDQRGDVVGQLDANSGKIVSGVARPGRSSASAWWVCPTADGRHLLALTRGRVSLVNLQTGRSLKSVAGKFDHRISPIPCPDGFIAVPGYRARSMVRMTWSGEQVWQCPLPGYVMVHPASRGSVVLVQTRGGSYGGQATSAVEIDSGQRIWSVRTNAYGRGAAIGDGTAYAVETDHWLSPGGTAGRVICRDPHTGQQKWVYSVDGSIHHRPLIWNAGHLVYVLFGTGDVVCLAARSGDVCWRYRLPAAPARDEGSSYTPQRAVLRRYGRTLVVLDCRHVAHFLNAESGKPLASFPIVAEGVPDEHGYRYKPLAAPWLVGDKLIAATERWIAAYPAGDVLAGREPTELKARALRGRLLRKLGRWDEAKKELRSLESAWPASPATLALRVELVGPDSPFKDVDAEIAARVRLLHRTGAAGDKRLRELTGLVKRLDAGAEPTRPLAVGRTIYVGSRHGGIRSFDAATLRPIRQAALKAGVTSDLTYVDAHGGLLVFGTASRQTIAVSTDLDPRFDLPSRSYTEYYRVAGKLIRSWPASPYTHLSVLHLEDLKFEGNLKVQRYPSGAAAHGGKLYFVRPGGATVSFDGVEARVHDGLLKAGDFGVKRLAQAVWRINVSGTSPVAFGANGVFEVDEHLRPVRRILPIRTRVFAAAAHRRAVAALTEQADSTKPWLLEAWTADGTKKLPLHYAMPRYAPYLDNPPLLVPFGKGFLLVGRELVYARPDKRGPVWRFFPGGLRDAGYPTFEQPVVCGKHLFATHRSGDLLVFDLSKVLEPG